MIFFAKMKNKGFLIMQEKIGVKLRTRNSSCCWHLRLLLIVLVIVSVFYSFRSSASRYSSFEFRILAGLKRRFSICIFKSDRKDYLAERFAKLKAVNSETIGYVYAPGTQLDEPVVQTKDNATYLKTFGRKARALYGSGLYG